MHSSEKRLVVVYITISVLNREIKSFVDLPIVAKATVDLVSVEETIIWGLL